MQIVSPSCRRLTDLPCSNDCAIGMPTVENSVGSRDQRFNKDEQEQRKKAMGRAGAEPSERRCTTQAHHVGPAGGVAVSSHGGGWPANGSCSSLALGGNGGLGV